MEFVAYHKIKQFKDIIRQVTQRADYQGKDEEGEPIYQASPKPTIKFKGSVKLHGTNAMVYYTPEEGIMAGKRTSSLSTEQLTAHMGFNQFIQVTNKEEFTTLLSGLYDELCNEDEQIILYGEWCGPKIQKGVAISELPKSFYVFDCKIYNFKTKTEVWIDIDDMKIDIERVYKLTDFPTYEIEIDFNNPGLSQNTLVDITNKIEEECPVAKGLGVSGIGEGAVWKAEWNGERYIFKVKGTKHSVSKTKVLAPIDAEKLNSIHEFVSYACTTNRMQQAITETEAKEKKDMPILMKWLANDIISEEDDTLQASNLEWKDVARGVSDRIRDYFFKIVDAI